MDLKYFREIAEVGICFQPLCLVSGNFPRNLWPEGCLPSCGELANVLFSAYFFLPSCLPNCSHILVSF